MTAVMEPLIYVLIFLAVTLMAQGIASTLLTSGDQRRQVNRRLTLLDAGMTREEAYSALIQVSELPQLGNRQIREWLRQLDLYRRQANVSYSLQRIGVAIGVAIGVLWVLATLNLAASGQLSITTLIMTAIGAIILPIVAAYVWVSSKRNRRLKQIDAQLPMALDIMNRGLRAGHPVLSALQLAAGEIGDPLGTEFGLVVDETVYGKEFSEALADFAQRVGSPECHFFAVSVGIQAQTGGNLGEILDSLATVMRGRATLGRRIQSLSSEGRATAVLLSALVPFTAGAQMLMNPTAYSSNFNDPMFWPAVQIGLASYCIGMAIISRIINFRY